MRLLRRRLLPEQERQAITLEKFKVMARNIHLERFRSACLAGAGDPLLNRDFVPIMRYINETYPQCTITITTNGIACRRSCRRP